MLLYKVGSYYSSSIIQGYAQFINLSGHTTKVGTNRFRQQLNSLIIGSKPLLAQITIDKINDAFAFVSFPIADSSLSQISIN